MLGLSATSFAAGVPDRPVAPFTGLTASLTFGGETPVGSAHGDTRTVTGLRAANAAAVARWVEVEQESSGQKFSALIPAGQTVVVQTLPLETYWNTAGPFPMWDGLNIRWKDPA
jgi:hypothetical protein